MTSRRSLARIRDMAAQPVDHREDGVYPDVIPSSPAELALHRLNLQSFSLSKTALVDSVLVKAMFETKRRKHRRKAMVLHSACPQACTDQQALDICRYLNQQDVLSKSRPTWADAWRVATDMAAIWPKLFRKSLVPVIHQCVDA